MYLKPHFQGPFLHCFCIFYPTKHDLDTAFATTPICGSILSRIDGHGGWANSAAIRAAEAANGAPVPSVDPFDGQIIRLSNGEPSGVFLDGAMGLIRSAGPTILARC